MDIFDVITAILQVFLQMVNTELHGEFILLVEILMP